MRLFLKPKHGSLTVPQMLAQILAGRLELCSDHLADYTASWQDECGEAHIIFAKIPKK